MWLLCGLCYLPAAFSSYTDPATSCGEAVSGHCYESRFSTLAPVFSSLLCLRGSVHSLAGFYTNPEAAQDSLRRVGQWCVTISGYLLRFLTCCLLPRPRAKPAPMDGSGGGEYARPREGGGDEAGAEDEEEADISETLRIEIVVYTLLGMRQTATASARIAAAFTAASVKATAAATSSTPNSTPHSILDGAAFEEVASVTLLSPDANSPHAGSPHSCSKVGGVLPPKGALSEAGGDTGGEVGGETGGEADVEAGEAGPSESRQAAGGGRGDDPRAPLGGSKRLAASDDLNAHGRDVGIGESPAAPGCLRHCCGCFGCCGSCHCGEGGGGGVSRGVVTFREYAPHVWVWLRENIYDVTTEQYGAIPLTPPIASPPLTL